MCEVVSEVLGVALRSRGECDLANLESGCSEL